MKCPILIKVEKRWFRRPIYSPMDCLQEECAWWVNPSDGCALKALLVELREIQGRLTLIEDNMPHVRQFVK